MRNLVKKKIILILGVFMALALAASPGAWAGDKAAMPKTMVWSCYDVGSSGYMQASAIADAFGKKFGMRIRLLPSGTSIGRLMPLTANRVACGFLANEVYFASEGLYDFATVQWGPQDLRVVLAHPATIALATTKDSGIKSFKDLKGKRVSYIPGAPTLNVKMDAFLAFAGLTWKDVKKVEFPSYASSLKALIEGKTDASVTVASASIMYELETSSRGLYWIPFDPNDKAAWKRMTKVAPFLAPAQETIGAGISPEKPVWLAEYRYPMITVYADKDPNWVYNMAKAMDESFDLYKRRPQGHASVDPQEIRQSSGGRPIPRGSHPLPQGKGRVDRRSPGLERRARGPYEEAAGCLGKGPGGKDGQKDQGKEVRGVLAQGSG